MTSLLKAIEQSPLLKTLLLIFFFIFFIIIAFSSVVNIYENRGKILKFISSENDAYENPTYGLTESNISWANKIMEGGYILHFRHAERDKWIDVQKYDALESDVHNNGNNESRYAENTYFADAVCLNQRGKVQAEAMGEHIRNINLPIGNVVSSVSCRARQTAELAFNGYDSLHRILVHTGPYNENKSERINSLKEFYFELPVIEGKNTIVSAHNSVISCDLFINKCNEDLFLEEGGFYVISKKENGIYLEHEFNNFNFFTQVFYKR